MPHPFITLGFITGFVTGGVLISLSSGLYSLFFAGLPGIVIHEAAHWLTALLLRSEPSRLNLFPRKQDDRWQLGSVRFVPHWWSAGFVALAPGYLLPSLAWIIWRRSVSWELGPQILSGYAAIALLWSAPPSREDWRIALRYPLGTLVLLGIAGLIGWHFLGDII